MLAVSTRGSADLASERSRGRQPARAIAAAGISLALFAGIAYGGWRLLQAPAKRPAAICPTTTPSVGTVPSVPVRVLNGTSRRGLAGSTADLLRRRGFRIAGVGNAARLPGPGQVRYDARYLLPARLTALQVPGSALVADSRVTGRVDLVLGVAFRRLRTPAEITAAAKRARLPSPRPVASGPCG